MLTITTLATETAVAPEVVRGLYRRCNIAHLRHQRSLFGLAVAVAAGKPWRGRKVHQGQVLFISDRSTKCQLAQDFRDASCSRNVGMVSLPIEVLHRKGEEPTFPALLNMTQRKPGGHYPLICLDLICLPTPEDLNKLAVCSDSLVAMSTS